MLAVALFTACGSDDDLIDEPQQPDGVKTYTLTVEATKGDDAAGSRSTRALSLDGKTLNAMWAQGEAVTVYNVTRSADLTGSLTAQSSGATTVLKGTLTGSIQNGDQLKLKFLSPNYASQDGTLAYIAAHCDYAEATVTVTDASTPSVTTTAANFENQQAIVRFKLMNKAGDASLYMATLKISDGTHIYTVNRRDSPDTFYVAIPGFSGQTISMLASYGSDVRDYIKSNVSFTNGQYYEITVNMDRVLAMAKATTSSVGKVIATDGKLYSHVRTAELAGATASGIVAYVGTAGSVEEGNSTYKGIAISLGEIADPSNIFYCSNHADCNGEAYSFSDALNLKNGIAATTLAVSNNASHSNSHHAAVNSRNYSTARPAGASEWSLPSLGQWNMIAKGLTESNTGLSTTANSTFSYANIRSKVAAAGGWGFTWSMYWSTTQCAGFENAEKYNWVASFGNGSGNVNAQIKDNSEHHYNIFVRPFFAF